MAAPRPCVVHRCPNYAVPGGARCEEHGGLRSPSAIACNTPEHRRARAKIRAQGPPWQCSICGHTILSVDDLDCHHVVPAATGRALIVKPSHQACNRRRRDATRPC